MHEEVKKPDLEEVCMIEKRLIDALSTVVAHGVFSKEVDKDELGALVDMAKDMSETKKNCWEAHYYETVCQAMDDADNGDYDSAGYNPNRYANGRYAPKGHGNSTSGFTPTSIMGKMPPIYYDRFNDGMHDGMIPESMGYAGEKELQNKYGQAYMEFKEAQRHYTETKSKQDKSWMDEKALEHVDRTIMTLREIWKSADPGLRKEMKESLTELISEMPT